MFWKRRPVVANDKGGQPGDLSHLPGNGAIGTAMSEITTPASGELETAQGGSERRRRAGGRSAERIRSASDGTKYRNLVNTIDRTEILSAQTLQDIHDASLTVLEEIGMDVILPEARDRMKAAGADVTPVSIYSTKVNTTKIWDSTPKFMVTKSQYEVVY